MAESKDVKELKTKDAKKKDSVGLNKQLKERAAFTFISIFSCKCFMPVRVFLKNVIFRKLFIFFRNQNQLVLLDNMISMSNK